MLTERERQRETFFPLSSDERVFFIQQTLKSIYNLKKYPVSREDEHGVCGSLDRLQLVLHCLTHGLNFTEYERARTNHPNYVTIEEGEISLPAWNIHIQTGLPERSNTEDVLYEDLRVVVWKRKVHQIQNDNKLATLLK